MRMSLSDHAGYDTLAALALDVRWSWNHGTDDIWRQIDLELWEATQNPWAVLQTASPRRLQNLLADPTFRRRVDDRLDARKRAEEAQNWFGQTHRAEDLRGVAYFSMEFMLSEALPIYSGGLGNVAGDQLKAASDLGVPVTGVGLLYQQGYFRQVIDGEGAQQALYPYNDPGQLPITPLRTPDGEWLRLKIDLAGCPVWLRAWQVQVGRVRLYLLDTNDPANFPAHRGITGELYGGGPELRLHQEIVLGIGGWRLLEALGTPPEVCHLNEGHAAFAVLERARSFGQAAGQPFEVALAATRAGNLFTTHTAVEAGFDRFPPALIERDLGPYARKLGITLADLLALGRLDPSDSSESFNMAYLAIRGSGAVNGVSRLHGRVSRALFSPLYPRWPVAEVPVGHVTNGIHVPTWDSAAADALWTESCGKGRWRETAATLGPDIRGVSDARLWELRETSRRAFVDYVRRRLAEELVASGGSQEALEQAKTMLDPRALTLGFARRFAPYKRPNLLLHDPERLIRLLTDPQRPLQLVLAGKAHPADLAGQAQLQQWIRFLQRPAVRRCAVFLSDYDMRLTGQMVAGVDVWLNTPRRPWEACGTSGMKVLVNGGLNLSELDGWWAEAYAPQVGWALGDGLDHGDDPAEQAARDATEAEALYDRLEREVIPEFYRRDASGVPAAWAARMRESMARLTPEFSASRAVKDYTEQFYLPAASAHRGRTAEGATASVHLVEWRQELDHHWPALRFGAVTVEGESDDRTIRVEVFLGALAVQAVSVELYAEGLNGGDAVRIEMTRGEALPTGAVYRASIPASRPVTDYTVRVVPRHPGVAIPLECAHILWQR
jgi:starch phosphorylase